MTQKDKELLLIDLCGRLPYGIKIKYAIPTLLVSIRNDRDGIKVITEGTYSEHIYNIEDIKPYLRPMSSMTEEENKKLDEIWLKHTIVEGADYLNSIHVDYRGLIEKGLAIEVTEENNVYKE